MTRKIGTRLLITAALAALTLVSNTVSADVVPHWRNQEALDRAALLKYGRPSGPPSGSFVVSTPVRPSSRVSFDVALDLGGDTDSAVSFDFAALVARDPGGFSVSSATGVSYLDGFRLLLPARSSFRDTEPAGFSRVDRPSGFQRRGDGETFATAMFNLADFDGQTVLLTLAFDARSAMRRGVVNVENLSIEVNPSAATVEAAEIPAPGTAALVLAAGAGAASYADDPTPARPPPSPEPPSCAQRSPAPLAQSNGRAWIARYARRYPARPSRSALRLLRRNGA